MGWVRVPDPAFLSLAVLKIVFLPPKFFCKSISGKNSRILYWHVAQLGERWFHKPCVAGSTPALPISIKESDYEMIPILKFFRPAVYKEEKRIIITGITQYVVFKIRFPEKRVIMPPNILVEPFETNMGTKDVITYSEKYIPEEVFALKLKSKISGNKSLHGDELYANAEKQNREEINFFIEQVIYEYKKKHNIIGNVLYEVEKYELVMEQEYESEEVRYMVKVAK